MRRSEQIPQGTPIAMASVEVFPGYGKGGEKVWGQDTGWKKKRGGVAPNRR